MKTKEYVVGLYFDFLLSRIILIEKKQPDFQAGKLNGPGGVINTEFGESSKEAMVREFEEETSIKTEEKHWLSVGRKVFGEDKISPDCIIYFFAAMGRVNEAKTTTDEEIKIVEISNLLELHTTGKLFIELEVIDLAINRIHNELGMKSTVPSVY